MGIIYSFFFSKGDGSKTLDKLEQKEDDDKNSSGEEGDANKSISFDEKKRACGPSYLEEIKSNGAVAKTNLLDKVKAGLFSVRVSEADATQLQREVEGELFDKWHEGCEVMEARKICIEDIEGFLDHLQDAYEDIDEEVRRKMNKINWNEGWPYKVLELQQNVPDNAGARYAMIAFGKSTDGKFFDCMYCRYKMDFTVAPERIFTTKERSILWGLAKWQTVQEEERERTVGVVSQKSIRNFFRFKALRGFYNEGLINEINVVPSVEDVN